LATIDDATQDAALTGLMQGKDIYIGLNDKTTEGTFTWIEDGSALGYKNWYDNQPLSQPTGSPTNAQNTQSCVVKKFTGTTSANNGEWDDVGCNKVTINYACSMAASC